MGSSALRCSRLVTAVSFAGEALGSTPSVAASCRRTAQSLSSSFFSTAAWIGLFGLAGQRSDSRTSDARTSRDASSSAF